LTASHPAIDVHGLTKRFGSLTAVDDVSFDVPEGEIFGFLGPNGAGKTTLVRMLTTLIVPSEGSAMIAGCDVVQQPALVRREIGVIPQAMTSDLDLTGYENIDVYGRFYGIPSGIRKERVRYLLDMVGLAERANDLVATYSGGMRRRLELARTLVHEPRVLFLDEPTSGLDPQSRRVVWDLLTNIRRNSSTTLFLTTHYMDEAEALCHRIAIIDRGKIVVHGTPQELKRQIPGNDMISLTLEELSEPVVEAIGGLDFVHRVHSEDTIVRTYVESGARNLPALLEAVRAAGGEVSSATVQEQSLEDVFIHHTGRSIRDEGPRKVSMLSPGMPQGPRR